MNDAVLQTEWINRFEGLSRLEPEVKDRLVRASRIGHWPAGTVIFGPEKTPDSLLMLLDGTVRVQQLSEQGREIVLYRVHAGESCVLTNACVLAFEDSAAEGIAETDITAAAIPRDVFDELVSRSPSFRRFLFSAYSKRITDLFMVIEEIAFQRMDIRLAQKLLELVRADGIIKTTHQKMAAELGTAREVVSRQLAEFQRRGWVAQSRGTIELLDEAALRGLVENAA